MSTPIFQPRTLSVRAYAKVMAAICGMIVLVGILGAWLGWFSIPSLAVRTALVAALGVAAVWAHARLQRKVAITKPENLPWIHAAIATLGIIVFCGGAAIMLSGTTLGGIMPYWMIPFTAGGTLAAAGLARRVGDSSHCPSCEYEFAFADKGEPPIRCPECGNAWLGRLKQGRKVRSPRIVALGLCIMIGGLLVMSPIFWLGPLARHLPTPILYTTLYASPKNAYTAWDELATRTLDPKWARILGHRVIAHRRHNAHDRSPGKWFELAAMSGQIPADLVDRFYTDGFTASIAAPRHVKAGKPFDVSLRVRRALDADNVLGVMFAGYAIDDAPPQHGRRNETAGAFQLNPGIFSATKNAFTTPIRIDTPGEHRIRAVYWLSYQKSFADELAWQPDGTPAPPPFAVWFRRVETETTVVVE